MNKTNYKLTLALPKGRLSDKTLELMEQCGIIFPEVYDESLRQLVFFDESGVYRLIFVKPADVPAYVERGIADAGVAGKDVLIEESRDIYELLDLGFGVCRLCVCGYENKKPINPNKLIVATKYFNTATRYFASKGENAEIIPLNGSIELAPVLGLSDVILDIVESGKTLEANGLKVLEEAAKSSARFIVNKVSFKTKSEIILPLVEQLERVITAFNE